MKPRNHRTRYHRHFHPKLGGIGWNTFFTWDGDKLKIATISICPLRRWRRWPNLIMHTRFVKKPIIIFTCVYINSRFAIKYKCIKLNVFFFTMIPHTKNHDMFSGKTLHNHPHFLLTLEFRYLFQNRTWNVRNKLFYMLNVKSLRFLLHVKKLQCKRLEEFLRPLNNNCIIRRFV